MSWIVGKKEQEIVNLVREHLNRISETLASLTDLLEAYLSQQFERIGELAEEVRRLEHEADIVRRQVENIMYGGAFLPNFRGDLLGIIEAADKVANKAEYVADVLEIERPYIPLSLHADIRRLLDMSVETYNALKASINYLFEDLDQVVGYVKKTEEREHDVDGIERSLLRQIFAISDISHGQKMHLKDLVRSIADIADRAEDCSDRVQIVSLKRRV
ncbi:TIGR00153 family protein [Pseudothermotoga sp.]|nr:TIGR00153 family protein [Pseudothermotoga sp.]MCX7813747.1 TIGR00153 family protein [Pseudothermotoga sp.]MDW8140445.1 TIGR00153 family protein [Pseudothermotoga sp.]